MHDASQKTAPLQGISRDILGFASVAFYQR